MIPDHKVTEIYFIIDEFFKEFDKTIKEHSLPSEQTRKRNGKFTMSESKSNNNFNPVSQCFVQELEKLLCLLRPKAYAKRLSTNSFL